MTDGSPKIERNPHGATVVPHLGSASARAPQAAAPALLPCPHCSAPHPLSAFVPGAECACGERLIQSCRGYDRLIGWREGREDCPDEADALPGETQCGECVNRNGMTEAQVWRRMERV